MASLGRNLDERGINLVFPPLMTGRNTGKAHASCVCQRRPLNEGHGAIGPAFAFSQQGLSVTIQRGGMPPDAGVRLLCFGASVLQRTQA
jgi:hypothetical protein